VKGWRLGTLWLVLVLLAWGGIEATAALGLHALERWRHLTYQPTEFRLDDSERSNIRYMIEGRMGVRMLSPSLGWTLRPSARDRWYLTNAQAIRADHEFAPRPPDGVRRIGSFGDSYTFGEHVGNDEVWSQQMALGDPALEVLNFGVGGYGLDQAYLRYQQDGAAFHFDVVLIGYMSENIGRHVNVFRPFYLRPSLPAAKPRFVREDGELRLLENPLPDVAAYEELLRDDSEVIPRLGEHDYYYQHGYRPSALDFLPSVRIAKVLYHDYRRSKASDAIYRDGRYNEASEAFDVTTAIFQRFYQDVLARGSEPVIVIFPHPGDFASAREDGSRSYEPLLAWLRRNGLRSVDALDAFAGSLDSLSLEELFVPSGHYTPAANEAIGRHVRAQLEAMGLIPERPSSPASQPDTAAQSSPGR